MEALIYRKLDKIVAGHVYARRTPAQTWKAIKIEIENICNSELGGVAQDYAIVRGLSDCRPGECYKVDKDNSVVVIEHPKAAARRQARESLALKLKNIGLDDTDIGLLVR